LSYSSAVNLLNAESAVPTGCAVVPITDSCEAHLNLSGVINVEKELIRLNAKKEKISGPLKKLKTAVAATDYQQRVPEEVRTANTEKLQQLSGELEKVVQAIASITFVDQTSA
jgi:valyl-tRNA synthetase